MDEKSCGAVVFLNSKYLIIQSRLGHWDFPKGHVEKGESEEETAIREVFEETGLGIEIVPGFREAIRYTPEPGARKEVVLFLGKAKSSKVTLQKSELSGYKWRGFNEALETLTFDNAREVIKNANAFMKMHL